MIQYVFSDRPLVINNLDKADPQIIGEELAKISEKKGNRLKPVDVVEAARSRKNPLHHFFEWDDAAAANAYRLDQARSIIRSVSIVNEEEGEELPAFLSVTDKGGRSYRTMAEIQESPKLQQLVVDNARRDLNAWRDRYRRLANMFEPHVSQALEKLGDEDRPST